MEFLYEKQARRFYIFLIIMCLLQGGILVISGVLELRGIREALVEQEKRATSYLLEKGVPPSVVGAAWNHTQVTGEGERLLEKIGHTRQSEGYFILLGRKASAPLILLLLFGAVLFAVILLVGTGIFLQRREKGYENAERIVSRYAEGKV